MKTLLLIIRHLFPRKKWKIIETVNIWEGDHKQRPCEKIIISSDQFGNLRHKRIKG